MSAAQRDRFARARRELIDALQLWRMLSETPEEQRDDALEELVLMAERSLADATEEFLQAGVALGYPRPSTSVRPRGSPSPVPSGRPPDMSTEDLMALVDDVDLEGK